MTFVFTLGIFALCMTGMALGLILSNRALSGSCGGVMNADGEEVVSCGVCSKKEAELCPSDDPLVALAQISHPNPEHRR